MENKLERTMSDRVLGGVCSGLGNYFGIDPTIVRLIFCIAFFVFGTGLLAYIILWIAMPARNDARQTVTENDGSEKLPQTTYDNHRGNLAIGITLIVLGAWLLACNFIPDLNLLKFWPVAIIVIGIVLIFNSFKTSKKKEEES